MATEVEPPAPRDPVFHSFISDCLPDDHPLAWETVLCVVCGTMVHAVNNETMADWFETGRGPYCMACFVAVWGVGDGWDWSDDWGVR